MRYRRATLVVLLYGWFKQSCPQAIGLILLLLAAKPLAMPIERVNYLIYGESTEPLQIVDEHPSGPGLVTELVREVFSHPGYQLKEIVRPINRTRREMATGEATRWVAYALRSWTESENWDKATFADVDIMQYGLALASPTPLKSLEANALKKNGVVWIQGYRYPGATQFSDRYDFEFLRASNHLSALKMIDAKRGLYFMEQPDRIRFALRKMGRDPEELHYYGLDKEIAPTAITLLMSNDLGPENHDFINRTLLAMARDGRLQMLRQKYLHSNSFDLSKTGAP